MESIKNQNKSSVSLFGLFRKLFICVVELVFPSILIIKVQFMLSKASWSNHPWFRAQAKKAFIAGFTLLIPSLLAIGYIVEASSHLPVVNNLYERPRFLVKKGKYVLAYKEFLAGYERLRLKDFARRAGLLLLIPAFFSVYIRYTNKVLVKTRKLHEVLRNAHFWKDGRESMAVFTPIGIVLDLAGHDPKEILANKTIWYGLNLRVDEKDWSEKPGQMSVVLFKSSFVLLPKYDYDVEPS